MSGYVFGYVILSLARQGHPIAIATLLNYVTQPHGIKLRVRRQDDRLQMLLESQQVPPMPAAIEFVQHSMKILNVEQITTVDIYGRQQGNWVPAWQKTIYLETESCWKHHASLTGLVDRFVPLSVEEKSVEENPVAPIPLSSSENPIPAMESSEAPLALNETETSAIVLQETETAPAREISSASENPHERHAPDLLRRPESVIFLFFISLFLFWDTYLSLLEEADRSPMQAHSTSQLSRRLKTAKGAIRRRKYAPDFSEWTQRLDPDGIAWSYQRGLYIPQLEQG
ncbi:hypothetical protein [Thermocoleostomius sinensis]|uniref:Uncharacterized protein n=1 Tax=Thermocoleostomius sinensis A174 TaxID=2016057 RepID=A0A9E9CC77_9CYAN|nr:hypothetical protein [Thermocoleostomius sinensis]WAL62210.1 hypothetical protein OXH18_09545 [Thermocoleostomius sinensis A174]